jgi:hypothetical protein
MPQNVETEMLLITSDDYWGHAGDFDPAVNFYPYTFIITQSQYAGMDDSDKGRFFPCALFYYAGETDNHGFQPRRIGCRVEDDDTVSVGRVMGINRQGDQEVRTYRIGTEQGYAIPGYASMSMLKGEGDSYEAIESAAEAGNLPVGGFDISQLIYNQEAVVDTINAVAGIETVSEAENYSAEQATPFEYEGAEPEAYVARPEATPVGYEVDDNSAAVEDYFASEGYDFNHTVGDFAQDSAAGSGYGVPEYYGSNSMSPMVFNADMKEISQEWDDAVENDYEEMKSLGKTKYERGNTVDTNQRKVYEKYGDKVTTARTVAEASKKLNAEVMYGTDGSVVGQAIGNWDSTPFGYQAEGDEGPEVMWEQDEFVSVRDGSARDAIADEYIDMGEDYDDAEDYARRAAKKMSAEGLGDYTGPLTNGFGENSASVSDYGVPVWYGSAEEAYNGMGENSASISGQGVPQWYGSAEELPVGVGMPAVDDGFYPNSYGEDSSTFGQGVPQWYGSAEQGYNDKMDESLGMRHRGSHSQSMKDRRDEAAAMDKDHSMMGRKYDDVMTMDAEPVVKVQKSETKMAMAIGAAVLGALTAYTISKKVGSSSPEEPEEEPEE